MKAAVLHANNDIRYEDYPEPETGPGMVKIAVKASGICGSDVPRVLHNGAHFYPIVLGHEFSGVVAELGEGVENVSVGDTVTGAPRIVCHTCRDCLTGNFSQCKNDSFIGSRSQGSFADYLVIPATNVVPYDSSIPFDVATFFEPATIGLRGILNNQYRGGEYTAVIGAGTIGLLTLQWAKIFGSRKLVALDMSDARLEQAKALGADAVINTTHPDYLEQAMKLTDGRGYAEVFEAAGAPATLNMAIELAGPQADVALIGIQPQDVLFEQRIWELVNRKELGLKGCWQGYSAPFPGREWELTAHYFATGELVIDDSFIHQAFDLKEAQQAFDLYKNPKQVHGKVLLLNE